jgi:hypothetical protein
MIKHILIAVTTAFLVLPNLSSIILADPPEVPDDAGTHRPRFSAEDFAALTDARIAALKSGLQLKPTQEKKWVALETVLREEAKTHAARAAEPLYESLDDAQKRRFEPLLRKHVGLPD